MTKIDIVSGFLGAGKTTLIKKLIAEAYQGEQLVLIENEFGEIGIDSGFLKDAGINITEMNSGCICCSPVGDFGEALKKVVAEYHPGRIIIEPSGVGKLSDVIKAVEDVKPQLEDVVLNSFVAVVDAGKSKMYMKNFGEFFNNQIEYANTIILSRTQNLTQEKLEGVVEAIRRHNDKAVIITTPWEELQGAQIVSAMEQGDELVKELLAEEEICPVCGHHHESGEHDHSHSHSEGDHHHDHCHCQEEGHDHSHHHEHEEEHDHCHCQEEGHDHSHHHEHEGEHDHCHCQEEGHDHAHHHHDGHDHHDHHHHHHHADEVFTSWGAESPRKYTEAALKEILAKLAEGETYGIILRAKGIVPSEEGGWLHFDLTPGEYEVRPGSADYTGRLCVIGSQLKEDALKELFGV